MHIRKTSITNHEVDATPHPHNICMIKWYRTSMDTIGKDSMTTFSVISMEQMFCKERSQTEIGNRCRSLLDCLCKELLCTLWHTTSRNYVGWGGLHFCSAH